MDTSSQPMRQTCRVLLAEDTPDVQSLIVTLLSSAGHDVTAVDNGRLAADAALEAFRAARPYDLVLMDMQMPVMDGYTATSLLRAEGYTGRIVALTAHSMVGDREKCIAAGCDDYVTKPIEFARLSAIVASAAKPLPAAHKLGSTETDPDGQAVLRSEYTEHPVIGGILGNFVANLADRVSAMQAACYVADTMELRRLTHQLKGAAGSYGYPSLSVAARTMEEQVCALAWDQAASTLEHIAGLSQAILRGWLVPSEVPATDIAPDCRQRPVGPEKALL